jgi:ABC-2 type transport system permease protein
VTWTVDVLARIFSGVYTPLTIIPVWLRWISLALPHTCALRGIRQVMINGIGFEDPITARMFLILLAFCVTCLVAGIVMLNRAVQRAERGNGVEMVV